MKAQSILIQYRDLNELDDVARKLIALGETIPVWLFRGDMGVGKTTLIKHICKRLHVEDTVRSPTFSIINEYNAGSRKRIYHFDFYRIKNEAEAYDIGAEEYLYSGEYCFVEWPEKIESLWPDTYLAIDMRQEGEQMRMLEATIISADSFILGNN